MSVATLKVTDVGGVGGASPSSSPIPSGLPSGGGTGIGKIQARKFAFSPLGKARLFASYQRYAVALVCLAASALALVGALFSGTWWAWLIAGIFALKVGGFAIVVFGRWPEKLRLTAVAQRRIDAGRFDPVMIRPHCGDPCFKVVAREILSRAGLPRAQRESIIRRYAAELHQENHETIIIDHVNGVVFRSEGDRLVPVEPTNNVTTATTATTATTVTTQ